jgi:hypothetical protein
MMRWLMLLSLTAAALSCASPTPRSSYASRDIRRNEILMLDGKILDYRRELGLGPRPPVWLVAQLARAPVRTPPTRDPSGGAACDGVCELAEYICRAQEDICRIAGELGNDDWSQGKCWSAKASCAEATRRCEECRPAE